MLDLNTFKDIIFVSLGAVFGVNTRFIIYQKFRKLNINGHFSTLVINTFSSFILGIFISILPKLDSLTFLSHLVLFFSIGLLGSLSTFSTFVYDLFDLFLQLKFFRALKLFAFSFSLGIIAIALGYLLGN